MMSKTEHLRREWEERLSEFEASGQTATAWCAARGINIHRFRYWSSKLRGWRRQNDEGGAVRWLSVDTRLSAVHEGEFLTLRVGPVALEVREGFSPSLLRQVVQTLSDAW